MIGIYRQVCCRHRIITVQHNPRQSLLSRQAEYAADSPTRIPKKAQALHRQKVPQE